MLCATSLRFSPFLFAAAPSGFPFQCFWLNTHHHSARCEASSGTSVSPGNASLPKTFPLQSLTHARPQHIPVSRRSARSPRPEHSPAPRTPHTNRPPRMGFAPDSGYRHATANAVDNQLQRYSRSADGGSFFSHAAGVRTIWDNEENFRDLPADLTACQHPRPLRMPEARIFRNSITEGFSCHVVTIVGELHEP